MGYMIMDIVIVFYLSLENLAYRFGFIHPQTQSKSKPKSPILTDSQNCSAETTYY